MASALGAGGDDSGGDGGERGGNCGKRGGDGKAFLIAATGAADSGAPGGATGPWAVAAAATRGRAHATLHPPFHDAGPRPPAPVDRGHLAAAAVTSPPRRSARHSPRAPAGALAAAANMATALRLEQAFAGPQPVHSDRGAWASLWQCTPRTP